MLLTSSPAKIARVKDFESATFIKGKRLYDKDFKPRIMKHRVKDVRTREISTAETTGDIATASTLAPIQTLSTEVCKGGERSVKKTISTPSSSSSSPLNKILQTIPSGVRWLLFFNSGAQKQKAFKEEQGKEIIRLLDSVYHQQQQQQQQYLAKRHQSKQPRQHSQIQQQQNNERLQRKYRQKEELLGAEGSAIWTTGPRVVANMKTNGK